MLALLLIFWLVLKSVIVIDSCIPLKPSTAKGHFRQTNKFYRKRGIL